MKIRIFFAVILSFFALGLWAATSPSAPPAPTTPETSAATSSTSTGVAVVTRIVDGDTIELQDGTRVRYIGIDTPEVHPTLDCYGNEASDYNAQLVLGKTVQLVADVSNVDKYDRLLRYVYLPDGTFVNEMLVRQGYARAVAYPPDTAQQSALTSAQQEARDTHRGLWGVCTE
jgi:micrococcal nuclease